MTIIGALASSGFQKGVLPMQAAKLVITAASMSLATVLAQPADAAGSHDPRKHTHASVVVAAVGHHMTERVPRRWQTWADMDPTHVRHRRCPCRRDRRAVCSKVLSGFNGSAALFTNRKTAAQSPNGFTGSTYGGKSSVALHLR